MGFISYFTKLSKANFLITELLILWKLVRYWTITVIEFHRLQPVPGSVWYLSLLVHKLLLTNPVLFRIMELRREILISRNHFLFQKDVSEENHSIECHNYDYFSFAFKCMYVANLGNIAFFFLISTFLNFSVTNYIQHHLSRLWIIVILFIKCL